MGGTLSEHQIRRDRNPATLDPRLVGGEAGEAVKAAERVARENYGRLVAFLASRTHDVAAAEDALAEAFVAAFQGG